MHILLISHLLDFSGAPIALLRLASSLKNFGHTVYLTSLTDGPLSNDFFNLGVIPSSKKSYDLIIANTALSVPLALKISDTPQKILAWIHETQYFFNMLKATPLSLQLNKLKYVAVPSLFQIDEFANDMPSARFFHLRNQVDLKPLKDASVGNYYACSGYWETRKNQQTLVNLLAQTQKKEKVCFVGASKPNHLDHAQYVFTNQITLAQAQMIIARSKGFISPSLSETQNLAAIEAMLAGVPVLLSDIPAHRELKSLIPDILLFNPQDIESFKLAYIAFQAQWDDELLRKRLKQGAETYFNSEVFAESLSSILKEMQNSV